MDKIKLLCIIILSVTVEMSYGFFWLRDFGRIPEKAVRACEDIYAPEVLTTSCCKSTTILTQRVKQCLKENVILTSCEQAICIAHSFDILDDHYEVCQPKLDKVLCELDYLDEHKKPNELVRKYCTNDNYKRFPSKDPQCDQWKMLNCLFFSIRLGCGFNDFSSSTCKFIKKNVNTCKLYQKQYTDRIPSRASTCDQCGH